MKIKEKVIDCFTFSVHLSLCRLSFFRLFSCRRRRHLRVQGPEKKGSVTIHCSNKIQYNDRRDFWDTLGGLKREGVLNKILRSCIIFCLSLNQERP